jgi:hypothetical protein
LRQILPLLSTLPIGCSKVLLFASLSTTKHESYP